MIFVWRGWGPVVLVALFLPLASCAGLMDWHPIAAIGIGSLALLGGGLACRYFGKRWNKGSGFHSMYGVPVEIWGWVYVVAGGAMSALIVAGFVKKAFVG
jgi:hypothetical protein